LRGEARIPGDKSISHRALIIGALSAGETSIQGLLESGDALHTAQALRRLGVGIERGPDGGLWRVFGVGVGGLREPDDVLDLGNSGTGARLLMGCTASHPFTSFFVGDASLSRRPMARIAEPLQRMGAQIIARSGIRLPLAVIGTDAALPIEYRLKMASAQVKSAILLAGLNAPGGTTVIEPCPSRDHSEIMLKFFGAEITVESMADGARRIALTGQPELRPKAISIPADPSSAAFAAVAAAIKPGSEILLPAIGANPLRTGLYETLAEMGAEIEWLNPGFAAGERIADLRVRHRALKGVDVPPERAPRMIDEYPILGVAAAFAEGETTIRGAAELRVKESDRIAAMAHGLADCGVSVEELEDGLIIRGAGRPAKGGARVATRSDHRIAMSFLVFGLGCREAVEIDDAGMIDTSFPGFVRLMNGLGARIEAAAKG
jgi:3-phosphoshikimate 1-carboxyvinyltransferase